MNVEQKRRELFESTTTLPTGVEWNNDSKSYVGPNYWLAEYAWGALNKALDAVVIELPLQWQEEPDADISDQQAIEAANEMNRACFYAIRDTSLGLRVKP